MFDGTISSFANSRKRSGHQSLGWTLLGAGIALAWIVMDFRAVVDTSKQLSIPIISSTAFGPNRDDKGRMLCPTPGRLMISDSDGWCMKPPPRFGAAIGALLCPVPMKAANNK
ncbi:MAG: hypothetical protein JO081_14425 [Alphaproteobacteria bacterium]|nr:hypothetical protein [Alphaproteobacteria bacterium]